MLPEISRVRDYTDGQVLSDMHLLHPAGSEYTTTAFAFSQNLDEPAAQEAEDGVGFDADGDRIVKRRRRGGRGEVLVRHECETPLAGVGMQIWRGALLLADYVLHRSATLRGATVLELGCGCALTGLLAARFASHVVLTDSPVRVLDNAQHNASLNARPIGSATYPYPARATVSVRRLDFFELDHLIDRLSPGTGPGGNSAVGPAASLARGIDDGRAENGAAPSGDNGLSPDTGPSDSGALGPSFAPGDTGTDAPARSAAAGGGLLYSAPSTASRASRTGDSGAESESAAVGEASDGLRTGTGSSDSVTLGPTVRTGDGGTESEAAAVDEGNRATCPVCPQVTLL